MVDVIIDVWEQLVWLKWVDSKGPTDNDINHENNF